MTAPRPRSRPHAEPRAGSAPSRPLPPPKSSAGHEVTPLYGPEFARDPHGVYDRLRAYGALAPVEIAPGVGALLVIDYRAALDLFHDPVTWSKDSRVWQETVSPESPVYPMLAWRPNVFFSDGATHDRYRSVITDGFARVEPHELRERVQAAADQLISRFGADGEADLISQYAAVLPLLVFNRLFGVDDLYNDKIFAAIAGMFEGNSPEEAAEANNTYNRLIGELAAAKRKHRGQDLTSWFIDHPAGLTEEEVVQQIVITMGAGLEPTTNLIGNALARMLTDDRYYATLSGGALTPRDAIHDVLQNEPPVANYSAHYPRRDVFFHGTWVRTGQLVLVSYAACNTQHGRTAPGSGTGASGSGGGAHLSWAAGPHACPVRNPALLIATTAIERLTAWLSDIELKVAHEDLVWRNGPFHRALAQLPARFTPIVPDQAGATPWDSSPSSSTPQAATSKGRQHASVSAAPPPA